MNRRRFVAPIMSATVATVSKHASLLALAERAFIALKRSERRTETIFMLLLMSLGICLRTSGQTSPERGDQPRTVEDRDKVVQELRSLDSLSRSTERISYEKAILDFKAGKPSQAARELEPLHSAVSRNALGVILEAKGDKEGALAAFQDALELRPDFAEASYNGAQLLIREGRYTAAISQIQSVLARHQIGDRSAYGMRTLLAEAYSHLGQDERAAEILNALSVECPDSTQVHFSLGLADMRLGRLPEAVIQFQQELRLKPNEANGLLNLAKVLVDLRNYSEAVPYLERYIPLRPNDAQGYYALGYALQAMDRSKEAVEKLSHAARLSPKDYNVRFYLGMALWESGRPEAALPEFEAAERLKPEETQVHFELARVLVKLNMKQRAVEESAWAQRASARAMQNYQVRADACIVEGNLLRERGELDAAAEQFRQASTLDPKNAAARYQLGLVLAELNGPKSARQEFKEAITLDAKFAFAYNALGMSYKKEGKYSEAAEAFEGAIRINPQFAEAKNNLGTLYATQGENNKAAILFKEATEDSPGYAVAYLNWGLLLGNEGDLRGAKKMFEKALQLSPELPEAQRDLQVANEALDVQVNARR